MFWIGVAVFVFGLLASIAWHELGHLLPAKKFGVLVTQYMIGFGPTLWSRKRGETEYGIKAIPLGGYIRMVGMYATADQLPAATRSRREVAGTTGMRRWARTVAAEAREYSAREIPPGQVDRTFIVRSVPKRIIIMLGGPVANLVLAFALLAVANLGIGVPTATTTIGSVRPCLTPTSGECTEADTPSPAAVGGIQEGDEIVSWNGVEATDWEAIQQTIRGGGTDPVPVVVDRDGEQITLTITAIEVIFEDYNDGVMDMYTVPMVGISPTSELARTSAGQLFSDFGSSLGLTLQAVVTLPAQLMDLASSTFGGGERNESGVVGIVGVGRLAGEVASTPTAYGAAGSVLMFLQVLASLNMALFAFNLIPLLPLDGGHVAGAVWEALRRWVARLRGRPDPGPVDTARALPLTYVVVAAFILMFVLLTIADIVDPLTLTG